MYFGFSLLGGFGGSGITKLGMGGAGLWAFGFWGVGHRAGHQGFAVRGLETGVAGFHGTVCLEGLDLNASLGVWLLVRDGLGLELRVWS